MLIRKRFKDSIRVIARKELEKRYLKSGNDLNKKSILLIVKVKCFKQMVKINSCFSLVIKN
jgi:hypothetical protein